MAVEQDSHLGTDFASLDDFPADFKQSVGKENVMFAIARRLLCPRGSLIFHEDYGFDIRERLNGDFTTAELQSLEGEIRAECRKDERVLDADVTVVFNQSDESMAIAIILEFEDDETPFSFILNISALTVEILREGQTIPAQPSAAGAPEVLTVPIPGPPGQSGAPGVQGAAGTSALGVALDTDREFDAPGVAEIFLFEWSLPDLSALAATLNFVVSAYLKTDSGTGTFRLRLGGTAGGADGTLVATLTETATGFTLKQASGAVANPDATSVVKLTGEGPAAAPAKASIRRVTVTVND